MPVYAKIPPTIEAQYVARTVGPALSKGLAEIVEKRPVDPVEYLAHYLYKYVENRRESQKEQENALLVEKLRIEKEEEEKRQEEMRREAEELRTKEEELRREKEAEERRKKELEELAKRKEEVANAAPALPSLAEEEDQLIEFGETKLHQQAAVAGANLTILLKENYSPAARNSQSKTARDIANGLGLADNVRQIDEYIWELVAQENYKHLTDLIVLGFNEIFSIIEARYGNADQMRQNGLVNQAEQIYTILPQVQQKLKEIRHHVETNDLDSLEKSADKKWLLYLRDEKGRSPLHMAIEKKFLSVAVFVLEKCPLLSKLNDCNERYPIDYLKNIDVGSLDEKDAQLYEILSQKIV
ncbi:unnamed protein product [Brachionus calyciflorus]|uniref:Uncharacterized protein n=1 Tax=Brachionus calyciflorus TaxID=104777 RepID=A0A814M9L2_9BILA|nr:unnamed protein product [Brachionus calyciflorus]